MKRYALLAKLTAGILGAVLLGLVIAYYTHAAGIPVLSPSGAIGVAERDLMSRALLMMLIVVVPVYILIILIAWRYRAQNTKAVYTPNWENSLMEEFVWWSIPIEIILVLGALTWGGTHALAPEKRLESSAAPMEVDVVALPWKWLFIYPDEHIASVNDLTIPAGRPITFRITADAPMNSFWIPALGGQMYAMTGMITDLNLIANTPGEFSGSSANYSGEGFASMDFKVHAVDEAKYDAWVSQTKQTSTSELTMTAYEELAKPSGERAPVQFFGAVTMSLNDIITKFMPASDMSDMHDMDMPGMQ